MKKCLGNRPDCSGGWIALIEIHERGEVVEERPYGPPVLADQDKIAEAWKVFDGQTACEAVKPCPACKPGWVPPDQRKAQDDDLDPRASAKARRDAFWDDDEDDRSLAVRTGATS